MYCGWLMCFRFDRMESGHGVLTIFIYDHRAKSFAGLLYTFCYTRVKYGDYIHTHHTAL